MQIFVYTNPGEMQNNILYLLEKVILYLQKT